MRRMSVSMPVWLWAKLESIGRREAVSASEVVRSLLAGLLGGSMGLPPLVRQFVDAGEVKTAERAAEVADREAFQREALATIQRWQANTVKHGEANVRATRRRAERNAKKRQDASLDAAVARQL